MTWLDGLLVGFDLETTGIDPEQARIVTAAVCRFGGGQPPRVRTWVADPGAEIPPQATAIHGYSTESARTTGRRPAEVVAEVVEQLVATRVAGWPLVVMNAPYDLTLLEAEAARHGVPGLHAVRPPRVLDKHVDCYRLGRRRLEDLCRRYGVAHGGAHEAGADAVAACAVTTAIGSAHSELAALELDELHERQVRWAVGQQEGLRERFAKTPGKTHRAAGVRTEWPLIPPMRPSLDGLAR
ncbi:exonuclease domain-containing protein [Actinacidiphila acididurans]|uniref:3'-5' exonuclease n=1 Tax=Actinacidiphila acididurans TaxID=2784346 RepID=A0ABS2TW44_9ACTN|nr:exonuclease domain-containing protein [Actinacidiphila acididurans]MBM9506726.1 3'-5' exonuclease [Actinacidiphila acididurans]